MNDDIEGRLRARLNDLADHAWSEPSRSLTLEGASNDGPSHSRLRRLAAAAAVACVAVGAVVLLLWERGDEPDNVSVPATVTSARPLTTLLQPIDGCPADRPGDWTVAPTLVDYFDFVQLNGLQYLGSFGSPNSTGTLRRDALGERIGTVCFTLSEIAFDLDQPLLDGDASFLSRGTALFAIKGGDPHRRIAADVGVDLKVYEVLEVPDATSGAEMIDLASGFESIEVRQTPAPSTPGTLPPSSPTTPPPAEPHAVIDDPDVVRALIDDLASSPVRSATADGTERDRYEIALHRTDGSTTQISYSPGSSTMRRGGRTIVVPSSWGDAIEDALAPNESNVTLYVSNQSFEDDPVRITVTIDGEVVVDDDFFVEGQHNWVSHELELEPGRHVLVATSNTGATLTKTIRTPEHEPRWMVVDYWYYPDDPGQTGPGEPRFFTFSLDDEPILFD